MNANFHVYKNICLTGGYQYSRLYDRETSDANQNDHALLLGCNYQLPFCHLQLMWQKSLNAESETRSFYGDSNSTPVTYTHYYHKIDGFHLLVYIPFNKRKDKKD